MDTGYDEPPGRDAFERRAKTAGSQARTLILVDGQGAPTRPWGAGATAG